MGMIHNYRAECHCAVPLLFLLASRHVHGRRSTALAPCWGEDSVPPCYGSCPAFISSTLRLTRKPHPLRKKGRKQAVIPKGYYSSKSWLKHFICWVFHIFVCAEAWQKAGKVVKFSIEKHLKFFLAGLIGYQTEHKLSLRCAGWEPRRCKQWGVRQEWDVGLPPPLHSTSRIIYRMLCLMLVPGLKGGEKSQQRWWKPERF